MAKIKGKFIEDATITEAKLDINNAPTDNYVLTWDDVSGKPQWEASGTSDTYTATVSANDTTPGFLNGKLVAQSGKTTLTENNNGGNETLTVGIGADIFDKTVDDTDDITEGTKKFYSDSLVSTYLDTQKGANGGIAELDGSGKVPSGQLPAIALTDVSVVADITARDALTAQEGDVAIVTDASADPNVDSGGASYIYDGTAWQLFKDPTESVTSVNSKTGAVTLTTTDITEGTNEYFTQSRARASLSGGSGINYNSSTGEITLSGSAGQTKKVEIFTLDATDISNSYVDLTQTPTNATAVELHPVGGPTQQYSVDFEVITDGTSVKRVSWGALGLDGVLEATDVLIISYTY